MEQLLQHFATLPPALRRASLPRTRIGRGTDSLWTCFSLKSPAAPISKPRRHLNLPPCHPEASPANIFCIRSPQPPAHYPSPPSATDNGSLTTGHQQIKPTKSATNPSQNRSGAPQSAF